MPNNKKKRVKQVSLIANSGEGVFCVSYLKLSVGSVTA